jgi:Protein of unknown function (DUF3443)
MAACGGGSSSTAITAVSVTCTPTSLQTGQTSTCTATVTGTGTNFNTAVYWGSSAGVIDANGVFTAQSVTTSTSVSITATSVQDSTMNATATVTVTPLSAITVSCTPTVVQSRQTSQCNAFANGSPTTAVNWSTTIGAINAAGNFSAPTVTASSVATITAVTQTGNPVTGSNTVTVNVNNAAPIAVDGGPTVNGTSIDYPNGVYVTATVCVPSTTTCTTIDHVLVDTGSVGFRVLSSALGSVVLPGQNASDGNPMAECYIAPTGYAWGPIALAQVQVSGEIATSIPVEVIAPSNFASAPASCTGQTTGGALSTVNTLEAKGILGIGFWAQDCGTACAASPQSTYYSCPLAGCAPIPVTIAQQVSNPVAAFPNDNNGSEIQLPPTLATGSPTSQGSLIFGIGTQPNNGLNGATVYTVTSSGANPGSFVSTYSSNAYPGTISSGANANYFLTSAITGYPPCTNNSAYYCPSSAQSPSVTTVGTNGASISVTLTVDNADSLISSGNFAFSSLAGPGGNRTSGFIFGVPFFYGRTVFTALNGATTPAGPGPYFAF